MSYTNTQVSWQKRTSLNQYGDYATESSIIVRARKQSHEEVIEDENGKSYLTKNIYYLDPIVEPNATKINRLDYLDGELVLKKYEMCDLMNRVKMVRYITV